MAERLGVVGVALIYDDNDAVAEDFAALAEIQDFESLVELVYNPRVRVREFIINNDVKEVQVVSRDKNRYQPPPLIHRLSEHPRFFKRARQAALAATLVAGAYLLIATGTHAYNCTNGTGQAFEACVRSITMEDLTFGAVSSGQPDTQPVE